MMTTKQEDYEAGLIRGAEDERNRWIAQLLKDRDGHVALVASEPKQSREHCAVLDYIVNELASVMGVDLTRYRTESERQSNPKIPYCYWCEVHHYGERTVMDGPFVRKYCPGPLERPIDHLFRK